MGKPAIEIYNDLTLAYPDSAPSYMTVCRWITRFKEGNKDLNDELRSGAPITVTTPANIKFIADLIEENPYIRHSSLVAAL